MKHIKKEILIQFLDNELPVVKKNNIENHLLHCETCKNAVKEMQGKIESVKKHITVLNPDTVEIPQTIISHNIPKNKSLVKMIFSPLYDITTNIPPLYKKAFLYTTAAVLIAIVLWSKIKKPDVLPDNEYVSTLLRNEELTESIDANEWWNERRMVIVYYDNISDKYGVFVTAKNEEKIISKIYSPESIEKVKY